MRVTVWLEGSLRHKGLFKEAVALRQSLAGPEQARLIGRTFEREGFHAILRDGGKTLEKSGALVTAARAFAQSGDTDEAIALLEACSQRRCADLVSLKVEPDFDQLQTDPRFQKLLSLIGLP